MKRHLLCVLSACVLAGCASGVGAFTAIGPARPAKADNSRIDVFQTGLPQRPFERVALLDAHCESQWFSTPSFQSDVLPELMNQARAAGCDAIIEIKEKSLMNPGNFETRASHYTAIGVAYK
jgi:hypothetical protein